VLVLAHEELVPPASLRGLSDQQIDEFRCEIDVLAALRELGHDARILGVGDDLDALRRELAEQRPDVLFNLLVEFHGSGTYDQHLASFFELARIDYTGCNPRGLTLARDKALSKAILRHHGVRVPDFEVFPLGARARSTRLAFPLIVKSRIEEASLLVSQASIVHGQRALCERVALIHARARTDAIAEQYVAGRELYVGLLGGARLSAFPAWELCFERLPAGAEPIATRRVKFDLAHRRALGVHYERARLPRRAADEVAGMARAAYRALGLSGYARLDLRVAPDGRPYVLEANPNPDLTASEAYAAAARAAGLPYPALIGRIVRLARSHPAPWKRAGA
jgi:D-alanine-D-alanine ligase